MSPHTLNDIKIMILRQLRKAVSIVILVTFVITSIQSPVLAQLSPVPWMPKPGVLVRLSPEFIPAYLKGLAIHKNDSFRIDFFVNKGEQVLSPVEKKEQYRDLIKYFLAALATPDQDQWVNLSPYEKNRIIAKDFSKTTMGRDLLAEDYMLKQITASLIYPEDEIGRKFWKRIYQEAFRKYGTTNIPVNTFNKVWIIPDKAVVYENSKAGTVYILESKLKVMLEQDYLSLEKHSVGAQLIAPKNDVNALGSQIVREIVIPELDKEVNEGKNFAKLRQIYSAMILATWYKKALKRGILAKIYTDKAKVKGIDQDPKTNEMIYQRYLKAFKKGVYNYIKEEIDPNTQETIPRKYFSGGFTRINPGTQAMVVLDNLKDVPRLARSSFTDEASNHEIEEVLAKFNTFNAGQGSLARGPKSLRTVGLHYAMLPKLGRGFFSKLVLIGVLIANAVSSLLAVTPAGERFIANDDTFLGIPTVPNMNKAVDDGFDKIVGDYIRKNNNQLFTDEVRARAPYLVEVLRGAGIEQSANPGAKFIETVNKRVVELQNKRDTGKATPLERKNLDDLLDQFIFSIHRFIVKDGKFYLADQHSSQGAFLTGYYNCDSISKITLVLAEQAGFRPFKDGTGDVFVVRVIVGSDGKHYPESEPFEISEITTAENGQSILVALVKGGFLKHVTVAGKAQVIFTVNLEERIDDLLKIPNMTEKIINSLKKHQYGHANIGVRHSDFSWASFDQGNWESKLPSEIFVYDIHDGKPKGIHGDQINTSDGTLDNFPISDLYREVWNKTIETMDLTKKITGKMLREKPDEAKQMLDRVEQAMAFVNAHSILTQHSKVFEDNVATANGNIQIVKENMERVRKEKESKTVSDKYNVAINGINLDIQTAQKLTGDKQYAKAREVYERIIRAANDARDQLKGSDFSNMFIVKNGKNEPGTREDFLGQFSKFAQEATESIARIDLGIRVNFLLDKFNATIEESNFNSKKAGELFKGVVTKSTLEKEFTDGGKIFAYLMDNGFFLKNKGNPGEEGYPEPLTDALMKKLEVQCPCPQVDRPRVAEMLRQAGSDRHYSAAKKVYDSIVLKAKDRIRYFQEEKFPEGASIEKGGVKTLLTPDEFIGPLTEIAQTAAGNSDAARDNAVANGEPIDTQPATTQAATNSIHEGKKAYNDLLEKITSLNVQAANEFQKKNYRAAADLFAQIGQLIDDNKGIGSKIQDLTFKDEKGKLVPVETVMKNLSASALLARKNQNAALGREVGILVSTYNNLTNVHDPEVIRDKMKGVISETEEILKRPNISDNLKAKLGELEKGARERMAHPAMNMSIDPVGGIDFNSKNLDLQIQGDSGMITLPVDLSGWENIKIQGLIPTIIKIRPVGANWGNF